MSKMRRIFSGGENGFTLIELLVVIAVLGILAAIAIPRLGGVTDKARLTEAVSFAGTLRSAQEMYYAENNTYFGDGVANETAGSTLTSGPGLGDYVDSTVPSEWIVDYVSSDASSYEMLISGSGTNVGLSVTATAGGVSSSNTN